MYHSHYNMTYVKQIYSRNTACNLARSKSLTCYHHCNRCVHNKHRGESEPAEVIDKGLSVLEMWCHAWQVLSHKLSNPCHYFSQPTYMCSHRMHEMTRTAMEAITPMAAEVMTATSMATTVPWGYCAQCPHTGRQSEVFPTALQEKPSWHWSVLQLLPVKEKKVYQWKWFYLFQLVM